MKPPVDKPEKFNGTGQIKLAFQRFDGNLLREKKDCVKKKITLMREKNSANVKKSVVRF